MQATPLGSDIHGTAYTDLVTNTVYTESRQDQHHHTCTAGARFNLFLFFWLADEYMSMSP